MRRNDREITDRQEILKIMRKCDVFRLALNDDGFPYPVSKFIGDGIVIDLTEKKAGEEIKPVDLKPSLEQIQTGDFVILKTG